MKLSAGILIYCPETTRIVIVDRKDGSGCGIPSGKRDGEERLAETAIREVFEETGLEFTENDFIDNPPFRRECGEAGTKDFSMCSTFVVYVPEELALDDREHLNARWSEFGAIVNDSLFSDYNLSLLKELGFFP